MLMRHMPLAYALYALLYDTSIVKIGFYSFAQLGRRGHFCSEHAERYKCLAYVGQ